MQVVARGAAPGHSFDFLARRASPAILGGLIALGVLLRVRQYVGRRSLWLDELSVALNLATRGFVDLLRPLDYNQAAPILFLWVQELATRVTGLGELSLRFFPLVCGIAVLPAVWVTARRLLEPWAALCVTLLLAVSPLLVWHTNEVKPYAGDALAAALVILLGLRTLEAPDERRRWWLLGGGGVIALLGSTPALFTLGGVALALALTPGVVRDRTARTRALATIAAWGVTFAVVYFVFYRPVAQSGLMQHYWNDQFLRPDAALPSRLWHELRTLLESAFLPYVDGTVLAVSADIALGLAGVGVWYLARRHGAATAALVVTPLILAVIASFLHRYPFEPRLFLFAAPPLAILLLGGVSTFEIPRLPTVRLIGFAALFGLSLISAGWHLAKAAVKKEEARPAVEAYERLERGEPVMVFGHGAKSWVYYTVDWRFPDTARIEWPKTRYPLAGPDRIEYRGRMPGVGVRPKERWDLTEAERTYLVATPCAWLFFAHFRMPQVDSLLGAIAQEGGSVRREAAAPGAELHRACFVKDSTRLLSR